MTVNSSGTSDDPIKSLRDKIEQLEARVLKLETPWTPPAGEYPRDENKCPACGIDISNTMGFVCDSTACPLHPDTTNIIFGPIEN